MKQYLESLQYILENGEKVDDRTGVGTLSVFGYQMRFNLQDGFPATTTKKLAWKAVVGELLWFLEGSTDERRLAEITFEKDRSELKDKKTIWTSNADNQAKELGYINNNMQKDLGPVYGRQWRSFAWVNGIDQIEELIKSIKNNPNSRRHILNAWAANQIDEMALPPCHILAQFYVNSYSTEKRLKLFNEKFPTVNKTGYYDIDKMLDMYEIPKGKLSCQMYQRSADTFLGVPFNIASYSLLTHILAQICDLDVGDFIHTIGDAHIYTNHFDQVNEQLLRTPQKLPTLKMPKFKSLDEVLKTKPSEYTLENYEPMSSIKAPMAV